MLPKIFRPFKSNIDNLIRIGPNKDGGYVIDKRVINKTKKIITCGLNDDWEFERAFLKINQKCKLTAYDHTVDKDFWVKRFKKDIISLLLFILIVLLVIRFLIPPDIFDVLICAPSLSKHIGVFEYLLMYFTILGISPMSV